MGGGSLTLLTKRGTAEDLPSPQLPPNFPALRPPELNHGHFSSLDGNCADLIRQRNLPPVPPPLSLGEFFPNNSPKCWVLKVPEGKIFSRLKPVKNGENIKKYNKCR
jgi:hypothetical protein